MEGLVIPGVLLLWAIASAWIADAWGQRLLQGAPAACFKALVLLALLPLPLLDELLAQPRFEALCRQLTGHGADPRGWRSRPVYAVQVPREQVPGLPVPVSLQRSLYLDGVSHEVLLSHARLEATGGKLAQALAPDSPPLSFDGHCEGPGRAAALAPPGLPVAAPAAAGTALAP